MAGIAIKRFDTPYAFLYYRILPNTLGINNFLNVFISFLVESKTVHSLWIQKAFM